jgi:hypothetical protein
LKNVLDKHASARECTETQGKQKIEGKTFTLNNVLDKHAPAR